MLPFILAQVAVAPLPSGGFSAIFYQYLLPTLLTTIGAIVTAAGGILVMWLKEKAKSSNTASVFLWVAELARNVVAHVNGGLRADLEAAASDGTITPEEAKMLKAKALELLKQAGGEELISKLKLAGVVGPAVETFLSGVLERALDLHQVTEALAVPPVAAVAPAAAPSP